MPPVMGKNLQLEEKIGAVELNGGYYCRETCKGGENNREKNR